MGVTRIVPYVAFEDAAATEDFYGGLLGLEVMTVGEGSHLGFCSPEQRSAQLVASAPGAEDPRPALGVDMGSVEAVDEAYAEALRRGLEVVYGPVTEPWGIRRFLVRDPSGAVVSVLAHER